VFNSLLHVSVFLRLPAFIDQMKISVIQKTLSKLITLNAVNYKGGLRHWAQM